MLLIWVLWLISLIIHFPLDHLGIVILGYIFVIEKTLPLFSLPLPHVLTLFQVMRKQSGM